MSPDVVAVYPQVGWKTSNGMGIHVMCATRYGCYAVHILSLQGTDRST